MTEPYGGFPLPTDTALVKIESRQYRLFRLDLGEGIPRVAIKVGAAIVPPWLLVCWLVGVPVVHGLLIYLLPPALATWRALTRDDGGRLRVRSWGDRVAWLTGRHLPIVNAGTASATPPKPIAVSPAFLVLDLGGPSAQQDEAA